MTRIVRTVTRRMLIALLAAATMAAACSSDDGDGVLDLGTATEDGGDVGTVPGTAPPVSDEAPADGSGSTALPTEAPSSTEVSSSAATTAATAAPAPPPSPGPVGGFAAYYLRPAESDSILIDVFAQEGAAPAAATLDHLVAVLGQVSGKAVAVQTAGLGGGAQQWTSDQIRALGDANGAAQSRSRAVLRLFYLRGGFADSDRVVGIAVRSDVAAVFADRVDESAGVLGNRAAVEDAVSLHEVGHILGLVDLVLATGRQDADHPGHSPNRDSVMYYAVESTLLGTILEGGPPRDFDQADLDDLATIRNG